jgi:coenzyme F420-reducing hydrogenase delta subunit
MHYMKDVLKSVGLEPERLQMHFCSAAEGQKFQSTMTIMSKEISDLGPSPLKKLAIEPKKKTTAPKQTE